MHARRLVPIVVFTLSFIGTLLAPAPTPASAGARTEIQRQLRPSGAGLRPLLGDQPPERVARMKGWPDVPAPATPLAVTAPVVHDQFATLEAGTNGVLASPSDSTGALGTTSYVAAINVSVAVFDRTTHAETAGPFRLKGLVGGLAGLDTDPRVVYDSYANLFVLAFLVLAHSSSHIVLVTIPDATASDRATWCARAINGDQIRGNGTQIADYTALGFTSDRVTINMNMFSDAVLFDYVQITSVKTARLANCSATLTPKVFARANTRSPDGSQAFTIQPAQTVGGISPTTQFMASLDYNSLRHPSDIVLWRLRETARGLRLAKTAFAIGRIRFPPPGLQCSGSASNPDTWWDTGDLRLTTAFYDASAGQLYTATAVRHDFGAGSVSGVRWFEVDPKFSITASLLARSGYVGPSSSDSAWPSVGTDASGDLFVNYSEADLSTCISFRVASIAPGTTVIGGDTEVVAGQARYEFQNGSPERWGDYSAIGRDPTNGNMMDAFNSYALSDGSGPTPLFQQRVGLLATT